MLPEKEKPTKANRPPIPKKNKFIEKPQGRKAIIPEPEKLNKIVIAMKRNGDWVDLVVDLENKKGEVVRRVTHRATIIVVSRRPEDKATQKLDTILEELERKYHQEQACEAACLVGHSHRA